MKFFSIKSSFVSLAIVASFLLVNSACAEDVGEQSDLKNRFSVLLVGDFYTASLNSTNSNFSSLTNSARFGLGLGALSEASLAGPISWEYGVMVLSRQNSFKSSSVDFTESSYWLSVPVGLKLRFAKYFSLGAGGYLNYRVGDVSNQFSLGSTASVSFDVVDRARFETGVYAAVGGTLPINRNLGLVAEVRVMRGLSNLYKDSSLDLKSVDVLTVAGIQFSY